jgi:hypothetical protein
VAVTIVYGPEVNTVESVSVLVPATTLSAATVLLMEIVLDTTEPVVHPVPAPLVTGVVPFSVKHITVVPVLELMHVTVIGELELPEVGVQLGAVAGLLVLITKLPVTRLLGFAVRLPPAVAKRDCVDETDIGAE